MEDTLATTTALPGQSLESANIADPDDQLVAVRRIDWRFLLPMPALERVGFVGPSDSMLSRALAQFSDEFVVFDQANVWQAALELDVLVCETNDLAKAKAASIHLKQGGFLYAEWRRGKLLQSYRAFLAGLEQLGYRSLTLHWHRPDFESSRDLIPIGDQRALRHVFSRNLSGVKGYATKMFGGILISMNLIHRIVPCVSIVAQKGTGR